MSLKRSVGFDARAGTAPLPGDEEAHVQTRREALMFLILAVLIWPFIAVGVVAGYGFLVWMYYMFTGPPGPV